MNKTLLVVEDDEGLLSAMRWAFDGVEVVMAGDRLSAVAQLRRLEPPVVTLDLGLPPDPGGASEGLAALREILRLAPHTKVIVVTGNNDHANAVRAIGEGAWMFFQKPVEVELLSAIVNRAFRVYELEEENRALSAGFAQGPLPGIVCASAPMLELCRMVEKLAPADITVLLLGASGTGKELLARALHSQSPRAKHRFVALNCAAIPETLLESELFGHEKGAFTGAHKQRQGSVEYAVGGTLFLDEIGDLPLSMQVKLLRFLQQRTINRVGGREEIPVDVRVVCATHQDLSVLMQAGRFREDLYYRISEVSLRVLPLCERREDIVVLAQFFLERVARANGRGMVDFSPEALAAMMSHEWPGNVRELENRVKRAIIMTEGRQIDPKALDLNGGSVNDASFPLNLREARERTERAVLLRGLALAEGNISRAAELLGVTRPTCYALIAKYKLEAGSATAESPERRQPG
jgi:two-component system NtrC family response regulator